MGMNATALTDREPPDAGTGAAGAPRRRLVEVVVPVYNEQHVLEASVRRLHRYLVENLPYPFRITVADNASTDGTWAVAARLSRELSGEQLRLRAAGMDWPLHGLTMVGLGRLDDLQACIEAVVADGVSGDLIEAGSWRGGARTGLRLGAPVPGSSVRRTRSRRPRSGSGLSPRRSPYA